MFQKGRLMQLLESIETHGYFWLAEKPDNRLTGALRISEKGDASLEMFGAFESPHNRPLGKLTGERLHILGVTDKAGPVTLIDCIVVQQQSVVNVELLSKSNLHIGCVFWGAHFDTEEIFFLGCDIFSRGARRVVRLSSPPLLTRRGPDRSNVRNLQPT